MKQNFVKSLPPSPAEATSALNLTVTQRRAASVEPASANYDVSNHVAPLEDSSVDRLTSSAFVSSAPRPAHCNESVRSQMDAVAAVCQSIADHSSMCDSYVQVKTEPSDILTVENHDDNTLNCQRDFSVGIPIAGNQMPLIRRVNDCRTVFNGHGRVMPPLQMQVNNALFCTLTHSLTHNKRAHACVSSCTLPRVAVQC